MKRLTVGVVALLALSAGWLTAGGGASKNVEVASLRIGKEVSKDGDLNPFDKGTALEVIVAQPGKRILGLDAKASKLESFTDDKKTDLAKGGGPFDRWLDDFSARVNKDGTRILFTARSGAVPAPGATRIVLKAKVVLKVGADEKTAEDKKVALKEAKVKVGPYQVGLSKGFGGGDETVVEVSSSERNIKSVTFLDKDGKELKAEQVGSGSFGDGKMNTYTTDYALKGKVTEVGVRIIYFSKVETVTVPIDLEVGVGF
jgi:hypothetical protein